MENKIDKQVIPYKEAVALKELGYNDNCMGYYGKNNYYQIYEGAWAGGMISLSRLKMMNDNFTLAPLWQDAFDWFEKNKNIYVARYIDTNVNEILDITYKLKSWRFPPIEIIFDDPYDSFNKEIGNLACLKKIIAIVKENG